METTNSDVKAVEKNCSTCGRGAATACDSCSYHDRWIPNSGMACECCAHDDKSGADYPCNLCMLAHPPSHEKNYLLFFRPYDDDDADDDSCGDLACKTCKDRFKVCGDCISHSHHKPINEDLIKAPSHYTQGTIEVKDFIATKNLDFFEGNVVKYICRHRFKNGADDIKKAITYCEFILERYNNVG